MTPSNNRELYLLDTERKKKASAYFFIVMIVTIGVVSFMYAASGKAVHESYEKGYEKMTSEETKAATNDAMLFYHWFPLIMLFGIGISFIAYTVRRTGGVP